MDEGGRKVAMNELVRMGLRCEPIRERSDDVQLATVTEISSMNQYVTGRQVRVILVCV
jgi:hypothetical protein